MQPNENNEYTFNYFQIDRDIYYEDSNKFPEHD